MATHWTFFENNSHELNRKPCYFTYTAQTELSKLQRECRIMVGSRQAYAAESEDIIRRQL